MKTRLGWLGPAIVILGLAVGGVGVWYMVHAKPKAGAVIDTIAIDAKRSFVVRAEEGGDRSFLELHDGDKVAWQAIIPPYGGRKGAPGLAWSEIAVSVRVVRDGRAELFQIALDNARKLGGVQLAPQHGPVDPAAPGPVTLTDHIRSYELVSGKDWHQLVVVDLHTGRALWFRELGPNPIKDAGLTGGQVWVDQGAGPQKFLVFNGARDGDPSDRAL